MAELNLPKVLAAWGREHARATPITIGLINLTFRISDQGQDFALQRLHPTFRGEVNVDIDAITRHLASEGMTTPRVVPTVDGRLWHDANDGAWRMLTWLQGTTVAASHDLARFASAGALVARFHQSLSNLQHAFAFERPGAHDTPAHVRRLADALDTHGDHRRIGELRELAQSILAHPLPSLGPLPMRIIHGDLKLSNVLFVDGVATALVDLDTLQHGTLAVELGDALRSWCNPAGEDVQDAEVDVAIFQAAMQGYLEVARSWITREEINAIVAGLETIALELSSRFCLDALEERYFRWDEQRFASASHHNEVRARGQLSYAKSVAGARESLELFLSRFTVE